MFLRECLDSLLAQTVLPCRIILADDCSTDNTAAIAKEYGEALEMHETIRGLTLTYKRSSYRSGTIMIENMAAKEVDTPWMFYLDADDKLDPTYIEKALAIIEASDEKLFVVYSDMQKFGLWEGVWQVSEWDPVALRTGNYVNGHSIFRTDLFNKIGGLKDNGNFEDHQMWVDMMDLDPAFYGKHIPEALVWYRRHAYGHRTDRDDISKRTNI